MLRKKLDQINELKHVADLKLAECEKFISRLGKEYENRNMELKGVKENECKIMAELNKERNERKNLTIQHEKDVIVIHDLQRQVKEMELILRRKHPDSVSALIGLLLFTITNPIIFDTYLYIDFCLTRKYYFSGFKIIDSRRQ